MTSRIQKIATFPVISCRLLTLCLATCSNGRIQAAESPHHIAKRSSSEVLLVRNLNSPVSEAIADDYDAKRGVKHVLSIRCQDSAVNRENETIKFASYKLQIE